MDYMQTFRLVFFRLLCVAIIVLFAGSTQVQAQEYDLDIMSVPDASILPNGSSKDFRQSLECLSANGYGQWTASKSTGVDSLGFGWGLLGNGRYVHLQTDRPGGVVQMGKFTGVTTSLPTKMKSAANMDGRVVYVWPENGNSFHVQSLYDKGTEQQIDISLNGFGNPQTSRYVVKQNTIDKGLHAATTSIQTAGDFRDEYDIAIDGSFLYIAWQVQNGLSSNVYAMVVDLATGTLQRTPFLALTGVSKPTVACDIRQNLPNNAINPTLVDHFWVSGVLTNNTNLKYVEITSGVSGLVKQLPIPLQFNNPAGGSAIGYSTITHARILARSAIWTSSPNIVIYFIAHSTSNCLLMYNPQSTSTNKVYYVDGQLITPAAGLPTPTPPSGTQTGWKILDKPIVALSNPYDYPISTYDYQFHVLYQYTSEFNLSHNAIILARNDYNGAYGTTDSRTWVSHNSSNVPKPPVNDAQAPISNDWYVAAVNQMGIHIHWRENGNHWYARDRNRTFNEDIEENTLATFTCKVQPQYNGANITVSPGKTLTVWTDPNFGQVVEQTPSTHPWGLWQTLESHASDQYVSALKFEGIGLKLQVGTSTGFDVPSKLCVTPQFFMLFPDANQKLVINPQSIFEYYGRIATTEATVDQDSRTKFNVTEWFTPFRSSISSTSGAGRIELTGTSSTNQAFLNIYDGAGFVIGANGEFQATSSKIECKWGPSIYPYNITDHPFASYWGYTTGSQLNPPDPGVMVFSGYGGFDHCVVNTHIPYPYSEKSVTVLPGSTNAPQFNAIYTDFTNTSTTAVGETDHGLSIISCEGNTTSNQYRDFNLHNGSIIRTQVVLKDPTFPVWIADMIFDKSLDNALYLYRTGITGLEFYDYITIANNDFRSITLYKGTQVADVNHLLVKGFQPSTFTTREDVTITGNTFTTTGTSGTVNAAINLTASEADVVYNTITASKYVNGILQTDPALTGFTSASVFCTNWISNPTGTAASGTGISTDNWEGYARKNRVWNRQIGHKSGINDNGNIIYSKYYDNSGPGIKTVHGSAIVNLTGVHGPLSTDGFDQAAMDTIEHNNQSGTGSGAQIELSSTSASGPRLVLGKNNSSVSWWTNWANNNILTGTNNASDKLILGTGGTATDVGSVDVNFWGVDGSSNPIAPSSTNFSNITFTRTSPLVSSYFGTTTYSCANSLPETKIGGEFESDKNLSEAGKLQPLATGDTDFCYGLLSTAQGYKVIKQYRTAYDTLKAFIEHCAYINGMGATGFPQLTGAVSQIPEGTAKWLEYREWLKSVLWLNPNDPGYYCAASYAILSTFNYFDPKRGYDKNGALAVAKFLIDNNKCGPEDIEDLKARYDYTRKEQYKLWLDTTKNKELTPFDSTLPTLEELGLEVLRGPQSTVRYSAGKASTVFGDLTASNNPFSRETVVNLDLNQVAYVRFEIFDELGRVVQGDGTGKVLPVGKHQFRIAADDLAKGIYYARVSTLNGEVKTLKLQLVR